MDAIETLCPKKDSGTSSHNDQERRVVSTLLSIMDSIPTSSRIIIVGVTNRYLTNTYNILFTLPNKFTFLDQIRYIQL